MLRDYTDGKAEPPADAPKTAGNGPPRVVACPDCGAAIPETLAPGRHAPRRVGSRLINCVGKEIEP